MEAVFVIGFLETDVKGTGADIAEANSNGIGSVEGGIGNDDNGVDVGAADGNGLPVLIGGELAVFSKGCGGGGKFRCELFSCRCDGACGSALASALPQAPSCLLYTSPSPRDVEESRMPSSA